jgi:hypothetical protein
MILGACALGLQARNAAAALPAEYREYQAARGEFPPLTRRCALDAPFVRLPDEGACTLGAPLAPLRLVLWGDSHADQLGATVEAFATAQDSRVLQRVLRFCPPAAGYRPPMLGPDASSCVEFNGAVLAELSELRQRGLGGVVLSARWLLYSGGPTLSVRRVAGADPGERALLREGLLRTIAAVRRLGLRVLLIAPVPEMRFDVPDCFARKAAQPSACDVARSQVDANRWDLVRALMEIAAADAGVRVWDPIDELCDARSCFASRGAELLFHDDTHLSAAAARELYPSAAQALRWAAASE